LLLIFVKIESVMYIKMVKIFIFMIITICMAQNYVSVFEPYGNYCGYNIGDKTFSKKPVDDIDYLCMQHDKCVAKYGIKHMECHFKFAKSVNTIKSDTLYGKKIKNTIRRITECYEEKTTKAAVGFFGFLMLLNPATAVLSALTTVYSISENGSCIEDIKFILGSLYDEFI
jgi:hypothetical protein